MSLQSDSQGFLVGEVVAGQKEVLAGQVRNLNQLREIRKDVRSIARAIGMPVSTGAARRRSEAQQPTPAAPRRSSTGSRPATVSTPTRAPASKTSGRAMPARDEKGRFVATVKIEPQGRDGKGRFSPGNKNPEAEPDEGDNGKKKKKGIVGGGALSGAVKGASLPEGVDPTLNAAKEVASAVAPLGRGLAFVFGRNAERKQDRKDRQKDRKQDRWYTRILAALTKRVGGGAAAGGGGGGGGGDDVGFFGGLGLGGLASRILPFLGMVLTRVFAPVAAIWGSWKVGQWIGEKIHDWLVESGMQDKLFDIIDSIKEKVGGAWQTLTDGLTTLTKWFSDLPGKIDSAIRGIPVVGTLYGKAADATKAVASQISAGYTEGKGGESKTPAPETFTQRVARAVGTGAGAIVGIPSNAAKVLAAGRDAGLSGMELANFMGQNAHESMGFTRLTENLNYSAAGLRKTFGKYIKTDSEAQALAGDPESIANRVYGGRLGNTEAGDGFKYRGRGFVQLTGKANYAAAGKALGLDLVKNPDLAADPDVAAKIAAWYWQANVASKGAGDDVTQATKRINGGLNGLADRQKRVAEWQANLAAGAPAMPRVPSMATTNVPPTAPPKLPPAPELPEPREPLNSVDRQRQAIVVNTPESIGQNVGDRALAHIVTGGLGS